jgi:hypothetical protein
MKQDSSGRRWCLGEFIVVVARIHYIKNPLVFNEATEKVL